MQPTILLPVTGETDADRSTEAAFDYVERNGGTVYALYVVDTRRFGEPALSSAEVLVDQAEDEGRALLSAVADAGAERGFDVETRCCHGRPADELLDYAREIDADVVVLDRRLPHDRLVRLERLVDRIVRPGKPLTA